MPHPSCDRPTHSPASPPRLRRRAANPPRVPRHGWDARQGAGTPPAAEAGGATSFQCFVAVRGQRQAPRTPSPQGWGFFKPLPLAQGRSWTSAPAAVLGGGRGADPCPEATALAHTGAKSAALPRFSSALGVAQSAQHFLLSEGSFVPNRENGKAGAFLFRIPFPWGASSCSGRSSP